MPLRSVAVAVAVDVEVPLATIDAGETVSTRWAAGAVCVSVAVPETLGLTDLSMAVIVDAPTEVDDVTIAW